jgi:AsmA protein
MPNGIPGGIPRGIAEGLRIDSFSLGAPDPAQPVTLSLSGRRAGTPFTFAGTIGHPGFAARDLGPMPVDLRLTALDASVTATGRIERPADLAGVTLTLAARIPDLAALSPLAGQALPGLKGIMAEVGLRDGAGGLRQGVGLEALTLGMPEATLTGAMTVRRDLRADGGMTVQGDLRAARIDADALRAILTQRSAGAPTAVGSPPAVGSPMAAPARTARDGRLIPDTPIPFALLRRLDADLRLRVAELRLEGATYRTIDGHLVLTDGRLRVDPFSAQAAEGPVSATLTADATRQPPVVHLSARSPGITLKGLLAAMGVHQKAVGQVEMLVDLTGAGTTPRAIAASLNGMVGVAMAGGTIDTAVLGGSVGRISKDLAVLELLGRSRGVADIRCIAVRFDARDGIARARTLLLSSSLLTADGGGSLNLRDETLDLLLRPQGRVGGNGFRVPVRVTGPMRGPRVEVDASGAAEANVDKLAGIIIGANPSLGALGGLLGADRLGNEPNPCPGALALARGGNAPAVAASPATTYPPAPASAGTAAPASRPAPRVVDPNTLLRQLFR